MIRIKRVYEPPSPEDGTRILIDRLWPRGLTKAAAHVDLWLKEVAPSHELRQWYHHEVDRYPVFVQRYRAELQPKGAELGTILEKSRSGTVTLLFGAREASHSNASALLKLLQELGRETA